MKLIKNIARKVKRQIVRIALKSFHAGGGWKGIVEEILKDNDWAALKVIFAENEGTGVDQMILEDDARLLRRIVARDQHLVLKQIVAENRDDVLSDILFDSEDKLLFEILTRDELAPFIRILERVDAQFLRNYLFEDKCARIVSLIESGKSPVLPDLFDHYLQTNLQDFLLEENNQRLREIAYSNNKEPLYSLIDLADQDLKSTLENLMCAHHATWLIDLLHKNDYDLMKSVLRHDGYRALKKLLSDNNYEILKFLLISRNYELLKAVLYEQSYENLFMVLVGDEFKPLLRVLTKNNGQGLKAVFSQDDYSLLKLVLFERQYERLYGLLAADDCLVLKELLIQNHRQLLRSVMVNNDSELLRITVDLDDGKPFESLLAQNHYALIRKILAGMSSSKKLEVISDDGMRFLEELLYENKQERLYALLRANNFNLVTGILIRNGHEGLHEVMSADNHKLARHCLLRQKGYLLDSILSESDNKVLKNYLMRNQGEILFSLLSDNDYELAERLLIKNRFEPLKSVLLKNNEAILRKILLENRACILRDICFGNSYEILRELVMRDRQEPIKTLLFDENFKILRSILLEKNLRVLLDLMYTEGYVPLYKILTKNRGEPLRAILDMGNGSLLDIIYRMHPNIVEKAFDGGALSKELTNRLLSSNAAELIAMLTANKNYGLHKILDNDILVSALLSLERIHALLNLDDKWKSLSNVISIKEEPFIQRYLAAKNQIWNRTDIKRQILDIISEGDRVKLTSGEIKFTDRHSLWTLIHEILANEDYYFETSSQCPRILDCGTHFGMAIYYFKSLYPSARITGFEPVPALRALAEENIKLNQYKDVDILPYALSSKDEDQTFYVSNTFTMAGSLSDRRKLYGDDVSEIRVPCRRLSLFLNEPIDFLKLDIEGPEAEVLEEARNFLTNIHYIFCEYHHGMGLETDRLGRILLLLDQVGFDTHVSKSHNFQSLSKHRPMKYVDGPYSAIIWAKNRNWISAV